MQGTDEIIYYFNCYLTIIKTLAACGGFFLIFFHNKKFFLYNFGFNCPLGWFYCNYIYLFNYAYNIGLSFVYLLIFFIHWWVTFISNAFLSYVFLCLYVCMCMSRLIYSALYMYVCMYALYIHELSYTHFIDNLLFCYICIYVH